MRHELTGSHPELGDATGAAGVAARVVLMHVWPRHHGEMQEYLEVNRANWDERAPAHAASPSYAVQRFISEPTFLSEVVSFDRPRLGELDDVKGVHLQ